MNLEIGSTIGDYQVIGILGAGGMGKVYKVRNVISDRAEAMKVLLPDLANAPDLADRFLREIKVQASLEHPNIAALHTAVRVENQLLMLIEFVEGVTLEHRLREGPLPVDHAVDYVMQVLSALDSAHSHGVVHRDIKPANRMLTPAGVVKLMDFGIAKASTDHRLTSTGTTLGSLYYMSPEQIQGAANLDGRSDLYSVGVSLYELVTGKRPFDGDSQFAIMSAHLEKTPVPPITLDPRLPQALNDMILMSVSRDPNARFQTAGAFRNALSSIVPSSQATQPAAAPTPVPVPEVSPIVQPTQPAAPRSRRGLWIAIGALTTAAVVLGLIQFGPWKGTRAAPATQAPAAAPTATQQAPAVPTPTPETTAPPQQPPPSVAETPQPVTPAPQPAAASSKSARPNPASAPRSTQVVQQAQPGSQPVETPVQQQPVQTQAPPPQTQAPPSRPADNAASQAQLQALREQYMQLHVRASSVHTSLDSLQRSQAASGMNLRGDMQSARDLMDNYLAAANSAIAAGDAASAKSFMEKAEPPLDKLEKFLNK